MKSPFPGMDPYLEARWGDVHQSLITYSRDALQPNLPPDLRARVEERVFVETNGRYDDIDYAETPIPALAGDDVVWAETLLKAAGKR